MKQRVLTGVEALPEVSVPEGYSGKVLLVAVTVGRLSRILLRAGGRWHRDILRICEAEVSAQGLAETTLTVRGGAHLCFAEDGSLFLWGRSEEFGTCDYRAAAALLRRRWPERKILCPWGEMP